MGLNVNMNMFLDQINTPIYGGLEVIEVTSTLPLYLSGDDQMICIKASCGIHWVMPPSIKASSGIHWVMHLSIISE